MNNTTFFYKKVKFKEGWNFLLRSYPICARKPEGARGLLTNFPSGHRTSPGRHETKRRPFDVQNEIKVVQKERRFLNVLSNSFGPIFETSIWSRGRTTLTSFRTISKSRGRLCAHWVAGCQIRRKTSKEKSQKENIGAVFPSKPRSCETHVLHASFVGCFRYFVSSLRDYRELPPINQASPLF